MPHELKSISSIQTDGGRRGESAETQRVTIQLLYLGLVELGLPRMGLLARTSTVGGHRPPLQPGFAYPESLH
jgi:hypothetical protein